MPTTEIRFPEVTVQLIGEDGNAISIVGRVRRALRKGGASDEDLSAYQAEALSGDYDHLLEVTQRWVTVT